MCLFQIAIFEVDASLWQSKLKVRYLHYKKQKTKNKKTQPTVNIYTPACHGQLGAQKSSSVQSVGSRVSGSALGSSRVPELEVGNYLRKNKIPLPLTSNRNR